MEKNITIYGAGLAGCEAAWQAAKRGVRVRLVEMKPKKFTPAHKSKGFAELVCSNSLRSDSIINAVGLLKEEMRCLGSLIMEAADATRVAAGSALAVDRDLFSEYVTGKIKSHPLIEVAAEEAQCIKDGEISVIATGPLTSDPLAKYIEENLGVGGLHFFDAAAPIVEFDSIDMNIAFFASRYDKGDADYINCPMDKEQYDSFYDALTNAREAELKEFDRNEQQKIVVFEGCMPVEIMAKRGYETLRFGPLKPVGLIDKRTGSHSYAVVQLRRENAEGTMYNLVGFQTHLAFPEQMRVFRMIPGLEEANFLRYGVMHRNTYLNSPGKLGADYRLLCREGVYFAGQITGVEGYMESTASGLTAGINAARRFMGEGEVIFPDTTMIGAMAHYVSHGGSSNFAPMNANFGIIRPLGERIKGKKTEKYAKYAERSLEYINSVRNSI